MENNIKKWLKEGKKYSEQGDYEKAIELYNKVLQADPENIDALKEIADDYYIKNKLPEALEASTKYLSVCREAGSFLKIERRILERIGRIYFLQDDLSMAIKSYLEALAIYNQLEPEGTEPSEGKFQLLYKIANIYLYHLKDYEQALSIYEHLLEFCSKWDLKEAAADNLREIGRIFSKQKKYSEALEKLEKALHMYQSENNTSGMALAQYEIGRIYFKQEKYEQVFPYLDDAFKVFIEYANDDDLDDEHSYVNKTRRMRDIAKNYLSK
ncbi:MAG: tetratricopeptide repeat protein [Candidatus Helarchaeota archaeon]|nr:tetratricopeptide repeat protein [Candidatus Helarchaeota archaeon]